MSPEIPFSSLPQSIQDNLRFTKELSAIKDGLRTDCVEILSKHGYLLKDKKILWIQTWIFSNSLNLKLSELSSSWNIDIPLEIEGEEESIYVNITTLGSGAPEKSSTFLLHNAELLAPDEFLVLSRDGETIRSRFGLEFKRNAMPKDVVQFSQLLSLAKANPPKKEES